MPESFGARLRHQREQRQVALATIADETKIKQSLLEALERDDLSQWPSGIFRRGFMRAYAHAIGLDPDAIVREFLTSHPDPSQEVAAFVAAAATDSAHAGATPPTRLRQLVDSAVTSLTRLRPSTPAPAPTADDVRLQPANGVTHAAEIAAKSADAVATTADTAPHQADAGRQHVSPAPVTLRAALQNDLLAAADLCTEFARARRTDDLSPLLKKAARILDATGLVVWAWDGGAERLRAAWAHGYSDSMLSHLPVLTRDASNATAAAFRTGQTRSIAGSDSTRGALVVPLMAAHGCLGVLAMELQGRDVSRSVRALATIFAAQLARILNESSESSEPLELLLDSDDSTDDDRPALAAAR